MNLGCGTVRRGFDGIAIDGVIGRSLGLAIAFKESDIRTPRAFVLNKVCDGNLSR